MGKNDKWDPRYDSWPSQQYTGRSWQIWPGARSPKASAGPPWKKGQGKGEQEHAASRFPAFDARPAPKQEAPMRQHERALVAVDLVEDAEETLVPGVQKALNGARKAEARVNRLIRDRKRTEQQWQEYVKESRAAYVREHERYNKAMEAYDREMVGAVEAQKQARLLLRHAAVQEELPAAMETEQSDGGAEWAQMVAGWEREQALQDDALLRRAFMEREMRTPSVRRAAPRSPHSGLPPGPATTTETVMPPPVYSKISSPHPAARVDPYPAMSPQAVPPMTTDGGEAPHAAHPPQAGTSPVPPQQRNPADAVRKGVKDSTKTIPAKPQVHSDIADKLLAKRTAAMMPFGRPPGLEASTMGAEASAPPRAHFLDDDLEEIPEQDEPQADLANME